ncbi:retroviral-like aspartic protease family protein [Nitrospirillum sp. BR 11164]|uniref:retroviral-like aspartic protease family protein n=1 Tax=Nitrospirillum sp. BR 11164 TaxID=3104324 RepID=UPI002AFF816D|nr:retroviral-like aspartic protease family protein [Nitrospirillum sp. BR 11164]MEA1649372.1 retroviral-like aspartic protease family protein [Nitrospirillum sp. BR 11164]
MISRHSRRRPALALSACALVAAMWSAGASAASSCKLAKVGVVPVTMDGNQPLINATVNGTSVHFLLDTGADSSILSRPAATRLNLHTHKTGGLLIGIDGAAPLRRTTIDTLEMGTYRGEDIRVLVGGDNDVGAGDDVVGVLGMDFLSGHDLEFDFAHNLLSLYKPEGCDKVELAYWTNSYSMVDMDDKWRTHDSIRLVITVDGQPLHAFVDSGATVSLLDAKAMRRLARDTAAVGTGPEADATPGGAMRGLIGRYIPTLISTFGSVNIGDETIKNAKMRYLAYQDSAGQLVSDRKLDDILGSNIDMILGADFLRSHRVYVAFSQRKIYFTYAGGPVFQTKGEAMVRDRHGDRPAEPMIESQQ